MTRYAEDSKERVRDAVDMLALIGARTDLRRAGANSYFGRCPFHDERTPSFHVRPLDKVYHCFGCQASGDPFTFVMESEGASFPEALELLADRFGVTLEPVEEDRASARRRERRARLGSLLERATAYYERCLWETEEAQAARSHLLGRGLAEEALRRFRVGYAPSAWDRMLVASRRAGFSEEELRAAGLAQRGRQGGVYDRFRARIMFPLADERGRVVGFGARAVREGQRPKYLNTSDGELYHKGSHLFGIDLARRAAARAGGVVVAEGYVDVVALHQAGIENAVGVMGTALTEEQVALLSRTAPRVLLALDADRAGQAAMARAAELAGGRRLELRVVVLPDGRDPADLLAAEGAPALRARVEASVPFVAFRVRRVLAGADRSSAEGRDRALDELRPVLGALRPSVLREELVRETASALELSEALTATLLARGVAEGVAPRVAAAAPGRGEGSDGGGAGGDGAQRAGAGRAPGASGREDRPERDFLALCLALPGPGAEALARVDPDEHFTSELHRRAVAHLRAHPGDPLGPAPGDDPELAALIAELGAAVPPGGHAPHALEQAALLLEFARLQRAIAAARRTESLDLTRLAEQRADVRRRLGEVSERPGGGG